MAMTYSAPNKAQSLGYGADVPLPAMTRADQQRIQDIENRTKAYRGMLKPPLVKEENQPDFNVLDNRCGPIVDKGVSWLFGQPLQITVNLSDGPTEGEASAGDEGGTNKAQDYLEAALGDLDDFMTTLSTGAINGGISGCCFIKINPAVQDHDRDTDYPTLTVLNPAQVWVEIDPDDCLKINAYNIQYPITLGNQNYYKRQRIAQEDSGNWSIGTYLTPSTSGPMATSWRQIGELVPWAYNWPPIVACPNLPNPNEYWGMPDLTDDIIEMNNALNFVQSNINKLLWHYGHPIYWTDSDPRQVKTTPGRIVCVAPGTSLNGIEVNGDIANALAYAATLRGDGDELSRVPAVALGRMVDMPKGNISGVALTLLFQPLIEKTMIKRRLYGRMVRDLCQRILALGGYGDGENLPVELHWPELLPVDELATLQALLIKQQLGASDHTIFAEMNLDYEEELARKREEAKDGQDSFNANMGMAPQAQQFGKQPLPN